MNETPRHHLQLLLRDTRRLLNLDASARIYVYSALVGALSGLAAVALIYGLDVASYICTELLAGYDRLRATGAVHVDLSVLGASNHGQRLWVLVLLPAAGGLLSGYIAHRLAPEAEGPGGDAMIDAFHNGRGVVRPVVPLVKAVTTVITLGSGGSAGKEGPVLHIGAGLGSWLGTRLELSVVQRRILLLAGTAAGLGAIFRAPLGGAITSIEVLYREDFEADALIPCVISSIVAYSIYMGVYGFSHIFALPAMHFTDIRELGVYTVLGAICALFGILYMKVYYALRDHFFRVLPGPRFLIVGLGGFLVGLLALIDIRTLGTGFGVIQQAIDGKLTLNVMLVLALLKIVSSSCTIGSGGSGGFFGPAVFIGGMLGGALGMVGQQLFPGVVQQPAAYVVVGMASFFGAVANTPLAALIIVTEMSGSYHLLPPLMLVSALTLIFARNVSIYEKQVHSRFHSPAHARDHSGRVLEDLRVADIFPRLRHTAEAVVRHDMAYFSLCALSRGQGHVHFVVMGGEDRRLRGMIRIEHAEPPRDDVLRQLILIEDMVVEDVDPIYVSDSLHEALRKLLRSDFDKLPVLRRHDDTEELLGHMTCQDLLQVYHDRMHRDRGPG